VVASAVEAGVEVESGLPDEEPVVSLGEVSEFVSVGPVRELALATVGAEEEIGPPVEEDVVVDEDEPESEFGGFDAENPIRF